MKTQQPLIGSMATPLDHAQHNQKLAERLFEEGVFLDWCVTVAYYACNHYAKYRLFPLGDHGIESLNSPIENLDDYCKYKGFTDKHAALCDLFIERVDEKHGLSFRKLMNNCKTARYNNYETHIQIARDAISTMRSLEKICSVKPQTGPIGKRTRIPVKAVKTKFPPGKQPNPGLAIWSPFG